MADPGGEALAPILDLSDAQLVRLAVAERCAGVLEPRHEGPPRRRVDVGAMSLEEDVEKRVDRRGAVPVAGDLAAADLLDPVGLLAGGRAEATRVVAKGMSGFGTTSAAQLAAINARSAKPIFGIFPAFTSPAIRCAIPRGNSSGTIAGACITLFNTGAIGSSSHVTSIKFRERWPFVPTRDGHWPRNEKTGGWIVTLDRNEHVQSTRVTGALPPQLWR